MLSRISIHTYFGDQTIPRRKQKIKYSRKYACKHLKPKGDISASLQPLCYCGERELVLGTRAFVCQVCELYAQTNTKILDVYEESRKAAEKKIKKQELEDELALLKEDLELDDSADEFDEEEEEAPLKYEKRKAGKGDIEDEEEYGGDMECPFCGEIFDDLATHIPGCEFAPDDASIEDVVSSKRKKKAPKKKKAGGKTADEGDGEKKKCPYCGKEFARLGRHVQSCKKKPENEEEESDDDDDDDDDDEEEEEFEDDE